MLALYGLLAIVWALSLGLTALGTLYSWWRMNVAPSPRMWQPGLPGVSILKPIKGVDPGLFDNLISFADIDYPTYEVILSVADEKDPAVKVCQRILDLFPGGVFRLIIGDTPLGCNPKVNNLDASEKSAKHDVILVSDSNVRAHRSYLQETTPLLRNELNGIITAPIQGFGGIGWGGQLEELHLNTFYARWMNFAKFFDQSFVMGKSMMYRRSVAEKFGGIASCAQFINEDYIMGLLMKFVGKRIDLMKRPIRQYVGGRTFNEFWSRHQRWSVIQKKSVVWVYALHPLQFSYVMAIMGAIAVPHVWDLNGLQVAAITVVGWYGLDIAMVKAIGGKIPDPRLWILREAILPFIWIDSLLTNYVDWRGHKLKINRDGIISKG